MALARKTRKAAAPNNDWISVPAAQRITGRAYATVIAAALRGELVSDHIAGRTVISRKSAEQYKARITSEAEAVAR